MITKETLTSLHRASFRGRKGLESAAHCFCFCCGADFAPSELDYWVDDETTALCPECSIDAVLGDAQTGPELFTPEVCTALHNIYFAGHSFEQELARLNGGEIEES